MVCPKCGNKIQDDAKFCPSCGTEISYKEKQKKEVSDVTSNPGDIKTFNVISYIGFLWIIGLFCGSKKNPHVRFHVGQGIMVTLLSVVLGIVGGILTAIIGAVFVQKLFGISTGTINGAGLVLIALINLATTGISIFYMVLGIIHAAKGEDKKLPIIGNLAFYK